VKQRCGSQTSLPDTSLCQSQAFRCCTQDLLKGMDADGRAKMEELLKNVRTKGPAGSGGMFGALPAACATACHPSAARGMARQPPCAHNNPRSYVRNLKRCDMFAWQVARAAGRSLSM
jgi:hypothetical protein